MAGSGVAQMEGVSKRYGGRFPWQRGVWALRDVCFSLPAGRVLGVLGPNRAGKTTLVKVLLSLCRADRGAVLRLGRPCADRSTLSRVGYLHESQAFPRYLSARELLTYYGALSGVGRYTLARRVNELLERVGLADRAVEPIGRYSKGMLQRLALAQALVNDPALLVLDEPSEGMDLLARRMLHEVVRQRRAAGQAVLLVSHSVPDVVELCDLALVLRNCGMVRDAKRRLGAARPRLVWEFHAFPHNVDDVPLARQLAAELEMDISVSPGWVIDSDWDGGAVVDWPMTPQPFRCPFLWGATVVNTDGGVAPCCGTFYREDDCGQLAVTPGAPGAQRHADLWNNDQFVLARRFFTAREGTPEEREHVCYDCPTTHLYEHYQRHLHAGGTWMNYTVPIKTNAAYNYFWHRRPARASAQRRAGAGGTA